MQEILNDLRAEQEALDKFLEKLSADQWNLPTPAEGWSIKDSISHIAHIDEVAVALLRGDYSPLAEAAKLKLGFTEVGPQRGRLLSPAKVWQWWREVRCVMLSELAKCDPKQRIPWFAQSMGARAFATARLMETWAHGLDCYDALGQEPEDTDRLRHIAFLAYAARPYAYQVHGLKLPETPLRLELILPSGKFWAQGEEGAPERISGQASEFCRVAVRRKHWQDTSLKIEREEARRFISIVQTYAGPPGPGRKPKRKINHAYE